MATPKTRTWSKLTALVVVMGLLLFVPAWTLGYWQGWVYLSTFTGASVLITLYLMRNDPGLLERRMRSGPRAEKRPTQKFIMLATIIGFMALLIVPSLDHRFGWSAVPLGGELLGDLLVVVGFYFMHLVYRENTFASATIQVVEGQRVISTGPYAVVRHPMYAGGALYLLGTPLALGSYWGLVAVAATLPFLIWRLLDEERFLAKNLRGYKDYCAKVRWRLIPGIF
jgi:protein-S-isoprenylcysteine O-methyltransferase Ste14